MGSLRDDTIVVREGERCEAHVSPAWDLAMPNGGYLATLCLRAASSMHCDRVPSSISCSFLSSPRSGKNVSFAIESLRSAKRAEALSVDLVQGDRRMVRASIWMRAPSGEPVLEHEAKRMPACPPPLEVPEIPRGEGPRKSFPFYQNLDERRIALTEGVPEWMGWYRFRPEATFGDYTLDVSRALILLDVLAAPAVMAGHPKHYAVATTLHTDVVFCGSAAARASEWLLVHMAAPVSREGFFVADGAVWSEDGSLLAHGQSTMMFISPVMER